MTRGNVVVITGSTGSGKSTTCRAFIDAADDLWLHFGIDQFLGGCVPRKFVDGGPRATEGVHFLPEDPTDPDSAMQMEMGSRGLDLVRCFHRMAAAAAATGQNVVLDHIATLDPPLLQDCLDVFRGFPVLFVGLRPPVHVIPSRLDARLETVAAVLGHDHAVRNSENKKRVATLLLQRIFAHGTFDLTIDTNGTSPGEAAKLILDALDNGTAHAFAELTAYLDEGRAPFAAEY